MEIQVPDFENYLWPRGSGVVCDAAGRRVKDGLYRLRQYFIDKNGTLVRNAAGRLIHVLHDDRGQPVLDEKGHAIFVEVDVGAEHLDWRGRPLLKLLKEETEEPPGR